MWSAARSSFLGEKQSSAKGRKLQKDKDRSELVQIMVSERFLWETSRQARNEGLDYLIGQRKEEMQDQLESKQVMTGGTE